MRGQAGLDGIIHDLTVQHRQRARHACANRTALGVGFSPKGGGASAENFGLGLQLNMDFQPNDHFITLRHEVKLLSRLSRRMARIALKHKLLDTG